MEDCRKIPILDFDGVQSHYTPPCTRAPDPNFHTPHTVTLPVTLLERLIAVASWVLTNQTCSNQKLSVVDRCCCPLNHERFITSIQQFRDITAKSFHHVTTYKGSQSSEFAGWSCRTFRLKTSITKATNRSATGAIGRM